MKEPSINKFLLQDQKLSAKAVLTTHLQMTYEELQKNVALTSSSLREKGISENDRVGIIGKNDLDFILIVLSLWQVNAVPVPINSRLTEKEINQQLTIAKCSFVLTSKDFTNKLSNLPLQKFVYPFELKTGELNLETEIVPDKTAAIIFTSGSSLKPKGVELSFNSFFRNAVIGNQLLRQLNSDRWLASLPFYHVGGFSIITRALLFGIPIVIPDSVSPDNQTVGHAGLISAIEKFNPTLISLVSTQLKRIVESKFKPNPEMKICLLGGGFINDDLIEEAINLGWPIVKVFGSTETCSFVTALLTEEFKLKPGSAGKPLPPNIILIKDENGNELDPFEVGEIAVKTPVLMKRYINEENSFNYKITDGFYFTGDTGYIDDEGYLFVQSRKNNLISTGGENVNPAEVEKEILKHPYIAEAVVFPVRDKEWGEIISAVIVLKNPVEKVSPDDLKIFLINKIAAYKIPKNIFIESSLPRTELGKIETVKLIEKYES